MRSVIPIAVGSVALGLDAYVVAGILPAVSGDLHEPESAVGQLVTVFTLSYALLAPISATVLARRPARAVLLTALLVFTVGNVLSAVSAGLPMLLASRVIAGLGAGLYAPTSAAAAASLAGPERRGRALAMITAGMCLGTVAGTPLGLTLAQHTGWRSTLWLVTGLGVVAIIAVAVFLPAVPPMAAPTLRAQAKVMTDRRVLAVVAIMFVIAGTSLGSYTYIAPLLAETLHRADLAGYLWLWGAGGLAGSFAVGALVDRWHDTRALVSVAILLLGAALLTLPLLATSPIGAAAGLVVWGAVGWGTLAPQQHRLLALRGKDGPVAVALNASALYLGSAAGAGIGGLLLGGGAGTVTIVFGAVAVLAAVVNLVATPAARPVPAPMTRPVGSPTPR